ncbi:uncharacterized protein DUF4349 [Anaerobacterium chartisolvens]|uniref:Uncharacterized protein DUF4349 n=1 Tax=Anaerobacterium chartisolvens TaxID=1297424 RepID=A0A369AYT6_9FIRM|nr:DUF4349 domain-containing protein [Anaerobacterium chartisolvens]RCX14311.1 uncharacterized protein DUF4349 [Anaerobacterium chartisolvens]
MLKKAIITLLLLSVVILSMSGCGSSKGHSDFSAEVAVKTESASASPQSRPSESAGDSGGSPQAFNAASSQINSGHKIIQTGEIQIETLEFEKSVSAITKYIASVGGYTESSSISGNRTSARGIGSLKNAFFTFRVPQDKYAGLFDDFNEFGTVVFRQSRGEDITDSYFDTEARLKSLNIQHERLLSLLQKAEKMEDILAIEKELQSTLYQIESHTGTIKKWDSLVSFSTVEVSIREVGEIQPEASGKGLFSRMYFGFTSSLKQLWTLTQGLLIFIVSALPFIIPLSAIAAAVYYFLRKRRKKVAPAPDRKDEE